MCTITVHSTPDMLTVTMNRDETLGRAPESPPRIHSNAPGHTWAAPVDGEKGGTWIGVNDNGLIACLMNAYMPGESLLPDTSGRFHSRGEIIPNIMKRGTIEGAVAWLKDHFNPNLYPSFSLLIISPGHGHMFSWFRRKALESEAVNGEWQVYSSSGWDSGEVIRWREKEFERWRENGAKMIDGLPEFHLLQPPGMEDRAPLMKRAWSATRSITQARVSLNKRDIEMQYWNSPAPAGELSGASAKHGAAPDAKLNLPLRPSSKGSDVKAT